MNKALRDGAFERPDLSDPQHYVREGLPGLTDRTLLPTKNIWKTIYETFPGQTRGFDLIETYPEVEDDPNQDVEWCVHQFLGSGGFGAVASWFRVNDTGDVVDEIAIKEAVDFHKRHKDNRWNGVNDGPLLREAVMHAQLNKKDGVTDLENENIIHLRGYKCFDYTNDPIHHDGSEQVKKRNYRFYQELAPYGDLSSLWHKYRYWNTYLPEAFLWHLLDSLASAAIQMRDATKKGLPDGRFDGPVRREEQVVHFDMKPQNVFLGRPDHRVGKRCAYGGIRKFDYPVIKLGDFGLSEYTGPNDPENPKRWLGGSGTTCYRPPEQCGYGANWYKSCPNGDYFPGFPISYELDEFDSEGERIGDWRDRRAGADLNFKMLEKTNVWAIGRILFDIMSLPPNDDYYWKKSTKELSNFRKWRHQIQNFDQKPFGRSSTWSSPYSKTLTDLVFECTRTAVVDRIDLDELKKKTEAGRQHFDSWWDPDCEEAPQPKRPRTVLQPKLFYKNNDINDMPRGAENFDLIMWNYSQMKGDHIPDPDWPDLQPLFDLIEDGELHREHYKRHDPSDKFVVQNGEMTRKGSVTGLIDDNAQSQGSHDIPFQNPWDVSPEVSTERDSHATAPPQAEDSEEEDDDQESELSSPETTECVHNTDQSDAITTDPSDTDFELVRTTRRYAKQVQYCNPKSRYKSSVPQTYRDNAKEQAKLKRKYNSGYWESAKQRNRIRREYARLRERSRHEQAKHKWASQAEARKRRRVEKTYQDALQHALNLVTAEKGPSYENRTWEEDMRVRLEAFVDDDVSDDDLKASVLCKVIEEFPADSIWPEQKALTPTAPRHNRARHQVAPYPQSAVQTQARYRKLVRMADKDEIAAIPPYVNPREESFTFVETSRDGSRKKGYYQQDIRAQHHWWNGTEWVRFVASGRPGDGLSSRPPQSKPPQPPRGASQPPGNLNHGGIGADIGEDHEDYNIPTHLRTAQSYMALKALGDENEELENATLFLKDILENELFDHSTEEDLVNITCTEAQEVLRALSEHPADEEWEKALAYRIILAVFRRSASRDEPLRPGEHYTIPNNEGVRRQQVREHLVSLPAFMMLTWLARRGTADLAVSAWDRIRSSLDVMRPDSTELEVIDHVIDDADPVQWQTYLNGESDPDMVETYSRRIEANQRIITIMQCIRHHKQGPSQGNSDDQPPRQLLPVADRRLPARELRDRDSASQDLGETSDEDDEDDEARIRRVHLRRLPAWQILKAQDDDTGPMAEAKYDLKSNAVEELTTEATHGELISYLSSRARAYMTTNQNILDAGNGDLDVLQGYYGPRIEAGNLLLLKLVAFGATIA